MPKESLLSSMPKLILAVVLIVCVGTVMGLMGYALTKKQTRVEAPKEIIEDETADWKTYQNEKYNYTIKYPKDWPINLKTSESVTIGNIPYEPSAGPLSVNVYQNKNITFLDEFKNNFPDGCQEEKEVSLTNLKAWKIICIEAFAGQQVENYFVERNNNLYYISFIRGSEELNRISTEMVESFDIGNGGQLTDGEIANWKIYRWEKECGNFEIKYPSNWKTGEIKLDKLGCSGYLSYIPDGYSSFSQAVDVDINQAVALNFSFSETSATAENSFVELKEKIKNFPQKSFFPGVFQCTRNDHGNFFSIECGATKDNGIYFISGDIIKFENQIDQILSSFKFIEK